MFDVAKIISLITSYSLRPAAARRARALSPATSNRRGGRMVRWMRGKGRRRTLPPMRLNGVYCAPSMRTGTIGASALSATMPGPSNTFISAPVTVIRPSGKITSVRPSRTALTIALAAIGLSGSTGKASNMPRNGLTHQARATRLWIAKVGLPGRKAASSRPSRNDTWLTTTTARSPGAGMFSRPDTSTR